MVAFSSQLMVLCRAVLEMVPEIMYDSSRLAEETEEDGRQGRPEEGQGSLTFALSPKGCIA